MARGLIKLTDCERDYYLEWSTISDRPSTYGMSLDELKAFVKDEYGKEGLRDLPDRLARLDAKGTSFHGDGDAISTILCNRAGVGETKLTYRQIVEMYCKRSGDIVGHKHDWEGACADQCPFEVDDRDGGKVATT